MRYDIVSLPLNRLFQPVASATADLVRLDERIAVSPLGPGLVARMHFADAVASLWVDGELVHVEDLVLHDAAMGVHAPTHALTIAHDVLRTRRRLAMRPRGWALAEAGLAVLRGGIDDAELAVAPEVKAAPAAVGAWQNAGAHALDRQMAEMDAVLARSTALLSGAPLGGRSPRGGPVPPAGDEAPPGGDHAEQRWRAVLSQSEGLPAVLRAALLLDAWQTFQVDRAAPWLGRLLAAALLSETGLAVSHLVAVSTGLRAIRHERRRSADRTTRLLAIIEAFSVAAQAGLREHDRLALASQQMRQLVARRRQSSRLPDLIDLVLSRPMVSAALIADVLGVTPQAAVKMTAELHLRELTGRERFRAWGVL